MARLPQMTLHPNRKLKISNEGDELTSDLGQLLFREFDDKIAFSKIILKHLQLKGERLFCINQNEQLFHQKFTNSRQVITKMMQHVVTKYLHLNATLSEEVKLYVNGEMSNQKEVSLVKTNKLIDKRVL